MPGPPSALSPLLQSAPSSCWASAWTASVAKCAIVSAASSAGDAWLAVLRVQRAGGKEMPIDAFLRGYKISEDTRLGTAEAGNG